MKLHRALRISPGKAAALVGAGGKSAAIAAMVKELEGEIPVVVTTTTHLGAEQSRWTRHHLIGLSKENRLQTRSALVQAESILVTGSSNEPADKWTGLAPAALADLWEMTSEVGGILLVEADGARRRWIKAPAGHEPVIPEFVNLVVPVVGIHALGKELDDDIAHRPELLADRLKVDLDARLEEQHVIQWAIDPQLALKGIPNAANVRILINQVDSSQRRDMAVRIAGGALEQKRIEALVLANIGRPPELVECIGRVAGIVLAAGGSSRAEGQKLLYEWRGKPIVRHVVEQGLGAGLAPLTVVVGPQPDSLKQALDGLPVKYVMNSDWQQGQSTSVRVGLASIASQIEAAFFLLADMPLVTSQLIRQLVRAHRTSLSPIVAPRTSERWGNPVLFDRDTFEDLLSLEGDRGGRDLFDRYPIQAVPAGHEAVFDCDTNEDLAWLTKSYP